MAVRRELLYGAALELYDAKQKAEAEEALARERDRVERRRKFITGIVQRLTSDGAFKLGVLLLWAATLCAWLYKSEQNSDARYVYSTSGDTATVFDKRTGVIYHFADGRWVAVNPITITQPGKR